MNEIITCPAPLDMLRRGSPVVLNGAAQGTLVHVGRPRVVWANRTYVDEYVDLKNGSITLDLTEATGRAHAAWWVAEKVGIVGNVTPILRVSVPMGVIWTCLPWPAWLIQTWQCQVDDDYHRRFVRPGDGGLLGDVEVAALSHLDPTDDTRLPDGSRVVDALALKAVVEHLISQMEKTS